MNYQLPPAIPYFIGAMLVIFGALRAYQLGWKRREPPLGTTDDDEGRLRVDRYAYDAKRHIRWGVIWVVMGLFLIISTAMNLT